MTEILTITLKPSLDYATTVPHIVPDQKLYCAPPRIDPGGGGINVARAIARLGGNALAFVVAGGHMGDRLLELLRSEDIRVSVFPISGETSFSFAVTDLQTHAQQRFGLPGARLSAAETTGLLAAIGEAAPEDGFVVLSGGVAPGLPDDFPQHIQKQISHKTKRLIVDTSKAPLARLVASPRAPLFALRIDRKEAERVAMRELTTLEDSLAFATSLVERGVAQHVVTARGAEGSLMVTPERRFFCRTPKVHVKSKIGAGDAFVGAMTHAFARGDRPEEALRWGVAAASATVGTEGTALFDRPGAVRLFDACHVETV